MKTWIIEIEIDTEDEVTAAIMKKVADMVTDDAAMRAGDEVPGEAAVQLNDCRAL